MTVLRQWLRLFIGHYWSSTFTVWDEESRDHQIVRCGRCGILAI